MSYVHKQITLLTPGCFSHSVAVLFRFSSFLPDNANFAPSFENSIAVAAPIPLLAPEYSNTVHALYKTYAISQNINFVVSRVQFCTVSDYCMHVICMTHSLRNSCNLTTYSSACRFIHLPGLFAQRAATPLLRTDPALSLGTALLCMQPQRFGTRYPSP